MDGTPLYYLHFFSAVVPLLYLYLFPAGRCITGYKGARGHQLSARQKMKEVYDRAE